MHIDVPTLMAAGSFVAAMSSVFVFFAWMQARHGHDQLLWAVGDLFYAAGIALLTVGTSPGKAALFALGALVMNVAPALFWTSSRIFNGRRPLFSVIIAGLVLQAAAIAFPPGGWDYLVGPPLSLSIFAAYTLATAWEYWHGRSDGLKARLPLVLLGIIQTAVFVVGTIEALNGRLPDSRPVPLGSGFGLVHLITIVYVLGTAVFVVALSRERSIRQQRSAAETDPLTGLATRGAFMGRAGEAVCQSLQNDRPLSVILFDLDHFKLVNDGFGHAVGDGVLKRFGETLRAALRPDDFAGRIGGEEFALVLPDTGLGAAIVIADRIRMTFEDGARAIDGQVVNATVSGGATTAHPDSTLDSILIAADRGLYQAKQNGRNRVERMKSVRNGDDGPYLTRVA